MGSKTPLGGAVNEGCPSLFPFCFLCQGDLEGLGQLVGTGGGLVAAADALDLLDGILGPHPLHQAGHPLAVAVAAAIPGVGFYNSLTAALMLAIW